ncbi:MAG: hypothetical protein ACJATN_001838 [Neolewinella sp.]|jgi:hypothetical protein
MLLNLTNHPSTRWSEKQLATAEEAYGEVQDLQFPSIPSGASTAEVEELAETYLEKVVEASPTAVHLQGEFTFVYALALRLQEQGIPVVASTSERVVEEREGKKIVHFNFVQFRDYPLP